MPFPILPIHTINSDLKSFFSLTFYDNNLPLISTLLLLLASTNTGRRLQILPVLILVIRKLVAVVHFI